MSATPGVPSRVKVLRRLLLAWLLGVLALSVVGMHQLSLGHAFAKPPVGGHHHAAGQPGAASADHHGDDHGGPGGSGTHARTRSADLTTAVVRTAVLSTGGMTAGEVSAGTVSDVAGGGSAVLTAATPMTDRGGSAGDDTCPGCGEHSMALGACLLALSLLVLSWLLPPPRGRLLPPMLRLRVVAAVVLVLRRVPPLTLAELSILRT